MNKEFLNNLLSENNEQYLENLLLWWYESKDKDFHELYLYIQSLHGLFPYSGKGWRWTKQKDFRAGTSWSKDRAAVEEYYYLPNAQMYEADLSSAVDMSAIANKVMRWYARTGQMRNSDIEDIFLVKEVIPLVDPTNVKEV